LYLTAVLCSGSQRMYGVFSVLRRLFTDPSLQASSHPLISATVATPLSSLPLVSYFVISLRSDATIVDAMGVMSDQGSCQISSCSHRILTRKKPLFVGVSSVAVVESDPSQDRTLLSVVSVTDVGRLVVPSQNKRVLATPLNTFIQQIRVRSSELGPTPAFNLLELCCIGPARKH
jgi:hypothetical protein